MENTYWHKQSLDGPLFPDIQWSRPENKQHAGKLLIVGGNLHGFSSPAEAFNVASRSGVGIARVLLPDSLKKTVGHVLESCEFAPSTPSGSFSQKALEEAISQASWADGVLIAGDLGRNSETAILLEKLLTKYTSNVVITKDAVDYVTSNPLPIQKRPKTTLVLSLSQLQRLIVALRYPQPIAFSMPLIRLVDLLNDFTQSFPINIIVKYQDTIIVAAGGQVSTTKADDSEIWRVSTATVASVWWLQFPNKTFEALTTGIHESTSTNG
jgi:ADP-dependent NAD(P)H-hydrate dehydratase / NAD(P)H-hydrate epimerase